MSEFSISPNELLRELPAPPEQAYETRDDLFDSITKFADEHGYKIVTKRSRKGRIWQYQCFHHAPKNNETPSRRTALIGCPFAAEGRRVGNEWWFSVKNPNHNHPPSLGRPLQHILSKAQKCQITPLLKSGATPQSVASALNYGKPDLLIGTQTVRRFKHQLLLKERHTLNPIQALAHSLTANQIHHEIRLDSSEHVNDLFFVFPKSLDLFARHPSVLFLDCTYQTNQCDKLLIDIYSCILC